MTPIINYLNQQKEAKKYISQILDKVELFLVVEYFLLEECKTARHRQMLSIGPIVVHPGCIFGIFPRSLLAQTDQSPRVQVRVVSVPNRHTHVTNRCVDYLFGGRRAGLAIGESVFLFLV